MPDKEIKSEVVEVNDMLRLRSYKPCDAEKIVSWCQNEEVFHKWGGDHFGAYPITAETMNHIYFEKNGNCIEEDNFYPMTAFDEGGICGHFIMRYIHGDNHIIRFGWVIVAPEHRGKGYGKEMLSLGIKLAREIYHAEKLSIGVFADNDPAHYCYASLGFKEIETVNNVIEMEL